MDEKDIIIIAQKERIAQQEQLIRALQERIIRLEEEIARLKKNSSNSSKPPSSDIVKPPPTPRRRGKRKRGGQPGHRKFVRQPFPPEQVDRTVVVELPPEEAAGLVPLDEWSVVQQAEVPKKLIEVTEYRARRYFDPATGRIITATLPPEVRKGGLCGAGLSALIGFLKSNCHCSFGTIARFCREVLQLQISRGQLAKIVKKVSQALQQPYERLQQQLPQEAVVGVDETGHHDQGVLHWTWCVQTPGFSFFHIDRSRGSQVLQKLLGEHYGGIVNCDYYSAYLKFARLYNVRMQYCLAHLIRELRFLAEHKLRKVARWGENLLQLLKKMFKALHNQNISIAKKRHARLARLRDEFLYWVRRPPAYAATRKLERRFRGERAEHYFRFIDVAGLEPTNNGTERALRSLVIDRKVTQGTCGRAGIHWRERSWTAVSTCEKQKRNVLNYLHQALRAHWQCQPAPQLI